MSSTFKNRIPKRKYRERAQPASREKFGLLEKKKDYKIRAKNYHKKQDMLKNFQLKARLRNEDEFYFKMLKGKRNEQGQHIQQEQDSDFDEKEFRAAVKTQNYNIVKMQRSITKNKIDKLKGQLQMASSNGNKHVFFTDNDEEYKNFSLAQKFNTLPQLVQNNMLQVCPSQLINQVILPENDGVLKAKYEHLANLVQKQQKLMKTMQKIGYQKNLLGPQRKKIKKHGQKKYHKFFMERKK